MCGTIGRSITATETVQALAACAPIALKRSA
jgi:hypothetical protein